MTRKRASGPPDLFGEPPATIPAPETDRPPTPALTSSKPVPKRRAKAPCETCAGKGVLNVDRMSVTMWVKGVPFEREMPPSYLREVVCPACGGKVTASDV